MSRICFITPNENLESLVREESAAMDLPVEVVRVANKDAVATAQAAAGRSAIVVARACQASLIRNYTSVPLVEVKLTGQEVALLVVRAKQTVNKDKPKISFVGFGNMFPNFDCYDDLFGARIGRYFVTFSEELPPAVDLAKADGADIVIGGEHVMARARELGLPHLPLTSTADSIREALRMAERMAYVSDVERRNGMETRAMLDYSFNGLVKLDAQARIVAANHIAAAILGRDAAQLIGVPIRECVPGLQSELVEAVFEKGQEVFSAYVKTGTGIVVGNLAPLKLNDVVLGAIFSFHEVRKLEQLEAKTRKELYAAADGAVGVTRLGWREMPEMAEMMRRTDLFAAAMAPVLICGGAELERELLAKEIHRRSSRVDAPFVVARCGRRPHGGDAARLLGAGAASEDPKYRNGFFALAHRGTLFFDEIADLDAEGQAALSDYLANGMTTSDDKGESLPLDVRVIAATGRDLTALVDAGRFLPELYYQIRVLLVRIPPLVERRECVFSWLEHFLKEFGARYHKFIILSPGAREAVAAFSWDGGLHQLKGFCEHIVVMTEKLTVGERYVRGALDELYGRGEADAEEGAASTFHELFNDKLRRAMDEYHGDRARVATALGISKTTLWRRLKSMSGGK